MTNSSEDILSNLLLQWEEAWEQGEELSATDLCQCYPELLEELQKQISVLKKMSWMNEPTVELESSELDQLTDPLVTQTLVDRYRIDSIIAQGGHGRVYRAFDTELQRNVAIKIPKASNTQSEAFLEEARKLAQLRHAGIVAVHDVGTDNGDVFIVTDFIEGKSLEQEISEHRFSVAGAVKIVAQIAENLHYAHEQGFVHRDIKPANILLDDNKTPYITDFGIASTVEELSTGKAISSGTLPYMPPEQLAGETQLLDVRTDSYSLGVVLYKMLTGQLPFQDQNPSTLREQILFKLPVPPSKLNAEVTQDLETICLKCLTKHPQERISSAKELSEALREVVIQPVTPPTQFRWTLPFLIMFGLLVAGGWYYVANLNQPSKNSTTETTENTLHFNGKTRIITSLERFGPVTLEAWVKTSDFRSDMFIIGSDIPSQFGIGMGIKNGYANVETIKGGFLSQKLVPVDEWFHMAVVYGEKETVLYFNGKNVQSHAPSEFSGGTPFVIGNVGQDHSTMFFKGDLRTVRISRGERYQSDFEPDERFRKDSKHAPNRALLIYNENLRNQDHILDLSGELNNGTWERFP